jgi:flagellum-specific peptidoglycan hydrolase FlgJ
VLEILGRLGLAAVAVTAVLSRPDPAQADGSGSVAQMQAQVVYRDHAGAITAAQEAVDVFTSAAATDQQVLRSDQSNLATANQALGADQARLTADQAALAAATTARRQADAVLAGDRRRLGALAVGVYTGALAPVSSPRPGDYQASEQQALDDAEVNIVAEEVDGDIHRDRLVDEADVRRQDQLTGAVAADGVALDADQVRISSSTAAIAADQQVLGRDQARLAAADQTLGAAENALSAALAALAGPAGVPPGQISLLGGSALDASQLVSWFDAQGYVDLTPAPIGQLAAWYLSFGQVEGVRGDVAFAQAVLETGGFSSPDAVELNNYAGIGHCDTCASGWDFPSPESGVLGQIQLLRIFAQDSPGPDGAPAPALAALVPADQFEAGCCATVNSLTGVWATDPTYGVQITSIYAQMLDFALSSA